MRNTRWVLPALASATLVMGAAPASAAVSVGHSGWSWGTPLPQGNTLRAVELVGLRGYAAGDFGTLLRTDDGGATWTGIPTGIVSDLKQVRVLDADTVFIGGACTARRSDNGGRSFRPLPFTPSELRCPASLTSLHFVSRQIGYLLLSDGTVLRTGDGGQTFSLKTAVPDTAATGAGFPPAEAKDILFTSAETGFTVTNRGLLYRTTDGAASWTFVPTSSSGPLNSLYFIDSMTGFAVGPGDPAAAGSGQSTAFLKTTDGGATWTVKPLSRASTQSANLTSIRCASATVCLLATVEGDKLLRTADGGDTATIVSPSTQNVFAATFVSPTRAVAVGETGTTVASDDAGESFSTIGGRIRGSFARLRATSSQVAHAAGRDGLLARTVNGGRSWTNIGVSTSEDIRDVAFPSENAGFALDTAGSAFRTTNGGASWALLNTGASGAPQAILALDPSRVLVFGPKGVRRSGNGGEDFAAAAGRSAARATLDAADHVGEFVWAHGLKALIASVDGGKTWKSVRRPSKRAIRSVDFVSGRIGYLLDAEGKLWRTRDRGRHWTQLLGTGTTFASDLAIKNVREGYLVGGFAGRGGGYLLRTSDGGGTWRPQLLTRTSLGPGSLATPGGPNDFLVDRASSFFWTATGGDAGSDSRLTLSTSRRVLKKPGVIKVTGRLRPPEGGEQVVVSRREQGERRTRYQLVQAASNGTFTTTWDVKRSTVFVAQWLGDDERASDGSAPLLVTVKSRR